MREILVQLDEQSLEEVRRLLQEKLSTNSREVPELLREVLRMTDSNFDDRYRFFYESIAPWLRLYRLAVGDQLMLHGLTRRG